MVYVSRTATSSEVVELIFPWIDALAREEYAKVYETLGYAMAYQLALPGPDCIRYMIESYRSKDLFPGEKSFKVTPWKSAIGGNKFPSKLVKFYKKNSIGIVGSCTLDLPLNGKWSDLSADFVWFENADPSKGCSLALEHLYFPEWYADEN
jgi:hypothetical protein